MSESTILNEWGILGCGWYYKRAGDYGDDDDDDDDDGGVFFLYCVIGGDQRRGAWYLTARGLADRIQFESYCLLEWHI